MNLALKQKNIEMHFLFKIVEQQETCRPRQEEEKYFLVVTGINNRGRRLINRRRRNYLIFICVVVWCCGIIYPIISVYSAVFILIHEEKKHEELLP